MYYQRESGDRRRVRRSSQLSGDLMRKLIGLAIVGIMGALIGISVTKAATPKLSGKDYGEINALYARYNQTFDRRDAVGYSEVFTPDGEFFAGPRTFKGRDAIKAFAGARGAALERPKISHVTTSILV